MKPSRTSEKELREALWEALDYGNTLAYGNTRCHPYRWKKRPQKQEAISALWNAARTLGGYGSVLVPDNTPT